MSFATSLRSQPPRRISVPAVVKIARDRAVNLGHSTVFTLLAPRPIPSRGVSGFGEDPKEPSAWDNTNTAIKALSTVVGTGTNFYANQQQTKLLQQQADAAAARTEAAQRAADLERAAMLENQRAAALAAASAPKGLPAWVLPVAIGGVLIAALGGYFIFKKKAV